jgi:hypothetical protein
MDDFIGTTYPPRSPRQTEAATMDYELIKPSRHALLRTHVDARCHLRQTEEKLLPIHPIISYLFRYDLSQTG